MHEVSSLEAVKIKRLPVCFSEQHDPRWLVLGEPPTPTLPEVQEPHHMGGPRPSQHYISLQPR